jgi:biotin-dependent carboxylase-like uncharacterized protein
MTAELEITRAVGLVTVQDAGRPGFMHLGIPPGGPLVGARYAAANRALNNPSGVAAIEIVGELSVRARGGSVTVADDEGATLALADGESFALRSHPGGRVHYLAVEGGLDVPIAYGGRGTLVVASLGGFHGRVLRAGDRLPIAAQAPTGPAGRAAASAASGSVPAGSTTVCVALGPDTFPEEAYRTLFESEYRVTTQMDRTGVRLSGEKLVKLSTSARSAPMVVGAIQVPPSGDPIVLGPDHPTTGGYPVVAVVVREDVDRIFESAPAGTIRFRARD